FQTFLQINTTHPTPDYISPTTFVTNFASSIPNLKYKTLYFTKPNKPLILITWEGTNQTLPSILQLYFDSSPAEIRNCYIKMERFMTVIQNITYNHLHRKLVGSRTPTFKLLISYVPGMVRRGFT
ncbi:hypothetical protein Leryth_014892, partial [Lithospermum erythrorhizon]